jgi:alpha-tubulin suppressor-like RCC1 family protein
MRTSPTRIDGLPPIAEIACGYDHVVVLPTDGTVFAWGSNDSNQLALDGLFRNLPDRIGGLSGGRHIAAGDFTSFAIDVRGQVWGWGDASSGTLGIRPQAPISVPTQISDLNGVIEIIIRNNHAFVID